VASEKSPSVWIFASLIEERPVAFKNHWIAWLGPADAR
jgi:hypothetical protein